MTQKDEVLNRLKQCFEGLFYLSKERSAETTGRSGMRKRAFEEADQSITGYGAENALNVLKVGKAAEWDGVAPEYLRSEGNPWLDRVSSVC